MSITKYASEDWVKKQLENFSGGTNESTEVILSSPNGTKFQITIGDDGVLTAAEIEE